MEMLLLKIYVDSFESHYMEKVGKLILELFTYLSYQGRLVILSVLQIENEARLGSKLLFLSSTTSYHDLYFICF